VLFTGRWGSGILHHGSTSGLFSRFGGRCCTTISVNELGLASICFKSVAHNTSCINCVHRFENVKRKHCKCKAVNKLIKLVICIISSSRLEVNDNCALPGYYAAISDNSLATFRDNLSIQSSKGDWTERLSRNVGNKLPLLPA